MDVYTPYLRDNEVCRFIGEELLSLWEPLVAEVTVSSEAVRLEFAESCVCFL